MSSTAEAQQPPAATPAKAAAAKAFLIGGIGAQPSLDDVVRVALGFPVALDAAGAQRLKQESPAPKAFQPEAFDASTAPSTPELSLCLTPAQARAVLAVRLLTLANGKTGCRLAVAEYLASLLNLPTSTNGVNSGALQLPSDASDADVLTHIVAACHGGHGATQPSTSAGPQSLEQAFAALALSGPASSSCIQQGFGLSLLSGSGLSAPGLSAAERAALGTGSSASAGLAALAVVAAKRLLTTSACIAALSIEAVGLQVCQAVHP